jgi:hypothetical protein
VSGITEVASERFAHGTRARYVAGKCRCDECRKANREYARSRLKAPFNGLVDAAPARAHLLKLSAQGVGRRAVAAACDVALSVLVDVRTGRKPRIRAETSRRILAVDAGAMADHALVPARETRKAITELRRAGLTKREIAERLGSTAATPSLQLTRQKVTAVNALKVRRLVTEVRAELRLEAEVGCPDCGRSHSNEARRAVILARPNLSRLELRQRFPCWYGGAAGDQRLTRDLRQVRALS